MSGETDAAVSGWTVDTLREHQRALRDADKELAAERDRRITEALAARDAALTIVAELARATKADTSEWRQTDRATVDRQVASIGDKIDLLREYVAGQVGKDRGQETLVRVGIAVAGLALAVLARFA